MDQPRRGEWHAHGVEGEGEDQVLDGLAIALPPDVVRIDHRREPLAEVAGTGAIWRVTPAGMQGRQMQPERLRTEPSPRAEPEMMRKDGR
jgi:hypothetical protein